MDRLILMDGGRIAAEGAPGEVLTAERLAQVYRIDVASGVEGGRSWLLPWSRRPG
ncbi:hypothetical protein D3C83_158910 [compost metagenome]